jgi:hypothetical protein
MKEIDHKSHKIILLQNELQSIANSLEVSNETLRMLETRNNELKHFELEYTIKLSDINRIQKELDELKFLNMQLNNVNERDTTGLKLDELSKINKNKANEIDILNKEIIHLTEKNNRLENI